MKLLLAVDIGNSETKLGLFRGNRLLARTSSRAPEPRQQFRELGPLPRSAPKALVSGAALAAVALASVVGHKQKLWENYSRAVLALDPFVISGASPTPLLVRYRPRRSLGPDRLAAAVAAAEIVGAPVIVAHLGTATVVDAVSAKKEFLGGAIAPGVGLSAQFLAEETDRLPRVRVKPAGRKASPLGTNTADCIRAGALYGAAGQVELLTSKMRDLVGRKARLVLTGGWAAPISRLLETKHVLRPALTLEGIQLIWQFNEEPRARRR